MKTPVPAVSAVVLEIQHERDRQVAVEGWTPKHDDTHTTGDLAVAAACYALNTTWLNHIGKRELVDKYWPWPKGWKPKDPRRDLIRATALLVAEIERRDRAAKS